MTVEYDAGIGVKVTREMRAHVRAMGGAEWLRKLIARTMPKPDKQPRSMVRYEEIGKLYEAGEKIITICAELGVTEGTVMRAARALGLPRRIRGRKARRVV